MPNKNKKVAPFMVFVMEYKEKHNRNMPLPKAIKEAGVIWERMSEAEKGLYKIRAKKERSSQINTSCKREEKYTSQGVPLSHIEKDKREKEVTVRVMKKQIQEIVTNSRQKDDLPNQKFFFIMGNYFACNQDGGIYLPAEIAISEFSLKDGITNKFHSFINPGNVLFGYAYEAREHSKNTHKLPLYPDAMGEKELGKLYVEILKFICKEDNTNDNASNLKPPAIYTHIDSIPIIKSMLRYLHQDCFHDDVPEIPIYPMQYLFYTMKMATIEIGEIEKPVSPYIIDAILEKDVYDSTANISCNFHEENDRTKYCALSCVVRWGYIFADNMCMDLALSMKPAQHCPPETDLSVLENLDMVKTFDEDDYYKKEFQTNSNWNMKNEPEINEPNTSRFIKTEDDYPILGVKRSKKNKQYY